MTEIRSSEITPEGIYLSRRRFMVGAGALAASALALASCGIQGSSGTGGLLGPLLPLFKMGLGGKIGSGKQWMSWISIDDELAALSHLMDSSLSGPVNLVAPNPVTNVDFTKALAKQLGRPAIFTIPPLALNARFGREMAEGTALANQRVTPARLLGEGFSFRHSDLPSALRCVLAR